MTSSALVEFHTQSVCAQNDLPSLECYPDDQKHEIKSYHVQYNRSWQAGMPAMVTTSVTSHGDPV